MVSYQVGQRQQRITSRSLDRFWPFPGGRGKSLYPEDSNRYSLSEILPSALGAAFLMVPTMSQETALIRGGKAPIVLISAVHGACCVSGRGTGLATPVAGGWLSPQPEVSSFFWAACSEFFPWSAGAWWSGVTFWNTAGSLAGTAVA